MTFMPRRPTSPLPASETEQDAPPASAAPDAASAGIVRRATTLFEPGQLMTAGEEPAIPVIRPILPDGEAILQPPMDNTPNDAPPEPSTRIPHLGHALLFLSIFAILFLLSQLLVFGLHPVKPLGSELPVAPVYLLASQAVTYIATLAVAWFLFPLLWQRPFALGIRANVPAATRNAFRLIPIGFVLSFVVQAASSLAPLPKSIPMDDFFRTRSDVWFVTLFGTLLAPLFEEVLFRGFLLPAFAIAYDWLSLPRTEAALAQWKSTNQLTFPALAFSAIVTSIFFVLLHGKQVAYAWPVLILLFSVSLVLTVVRLRLRSVMASTLVHASYNFAVFLTAFIVTGGYQHLEKMSR